ncbi:hypothetical protein PI124_g23127 [Phytophthora idaei]|nr:hypothetical protein PI124_g23127 [Phytophthora idaei]
MHYNVGDRSCYYCGGTHTDISGGPHFKKACVKRQRDRQLNVKRRDIWSRPREEKKARVDHDPTPKMKGEGKGKFKAKGGRERKVVPTEDCLLMCVPVDACNAEQSQAVATPASAAPCASPPAGCNFVGVNGGRVDDAQGQEEPATPSEQQVAEKISLQKMRQEETDAVSA